MKPLTREFLLSQGKCCKNNCKNCPWKKNKNMENKYYLPNEEDFRIGYEYEIFEDFDFYPIKTWHKCIYGKDGTNNPENMNYPFPVKDGKIRVPFLTKEQIESEGWILKSDHEHYPIFTKIIGEYEFYELLFSLVGNKNISIHYVNNSPNNEFIEDDCIFKGNIPSINEFRYICKLLNIK